MTYNGPPFRSVEVDDDERDIWDLIEIGKSSLKTLCLENSVTVVAQQRGERRAGEGMSVGDDNGKIRGIGFRFYFITHLPSTNKSLSGLRAIGMPRIVH